MQIVNIIKVKNNVVDEVTSFLINDDESSSHIVKEAEQVFLDKAIEIGFNNTESDDNFILDDGYYENGEKNESVAISWSFVENL